MATKLTIYQGLCTENSAFLSSVKKNFSDVDSDELEFIVNEEMQQYQILHEAVIIQQNKEMHEIIGFWRTEKSYDLLYFSDFEESSSDGEAKCFSEVWRPYSRTESYGSSRVSTPLHINHMIY